MRDKQLSTKEKDFMISASEIGQYIYCSVAWYLQKKGYEPNSPFLEIGTIKHLDLGTIIDITCYEKKKSNMLAIVGLVLFVISIILIILVEVI
jgi:hypothetical protein